jgi:YgiT-type zinc finger domain-containing protein
MKCGADVEESVTTDVFEVGGGVVVIRNIPCRKCSECAEIIYTGKIIRELEKIISQVEKNLTEVAVLDFAKMAA